MTLSSTEDHHGRLVGPFHSAPTPLLPKEGDDQVIDANCTQLHINLSTSKSETRKLSFIAR